MGGLLPVSDHRVQERTMALRPDTARPAHPSWPFDSSRGSRWPFSLCDRFTDHVSTGRAPRPGRVVRPPVRPSSSAMTSPASPAGSRGPSASSTPRSRSIISCRTARSAARPVGQRDLPPGRLGRRRGGEVLPGAAHGQRSGASVNPIFSAGDPEWEDCTVEVGVRPVARRHGRGRVPIPHEPPLLPVRVDGGRPGAWRCGCRSRTHSARPSGAAGVRRRSRTTLPGITPARGEPGREDPRLHRRPPDPRPKTTNCSRARPGSPRTSPRTVPGIPRPAPMRRRRIDERIASREAELAGLRGQNPRPKLWKQFATPKFGAGRNVRFGDLDGDGAPRCSSPRTSPDRRQLHPDQLPDGGHPRRQGPLYIGRPIRGTAS